MCQLLELNDLAEPTPHIQKISQYRIKFLKKAKKYFVLWKNRLARLNPSYPHNNSLAQGLDLTQEIKAGDLVRVRSKEEIRNTLDDQDKYKGCLFVNDMWHYCGGTYRVFKVVNYFYDEARYQIKKCKDTVMLDEVICSGDTSKAFKQKCDRSYYFFWKTAWLEKYNRFSFPT